MPSQAQDRPSSTTDPGEQFTTEQANIPHAPEPEAEQLALRFFAVINGYNRIPPERALWRELLKTAITSSAAFVIHHRKVTPALVHHVALEIYFHANAAGVAHLPQDQLAEYCHRPQASVSRALAVLERLRIIRRNRTSRRDAEIIEMNLGGLSWPAIRMRAKQARRMDQATTSRLNFEQPASPSDGMVPSLSYGTMPSPKGYVPGLGTDQITAAARTVRAREADERQQQQQQDRLKLRIDGLIAAIAVRARKVGRQFDETDERKRLGAGEIDLDHLQALADELAEETRHPQPLTDGPDLRQQLFDRNGRWPTDTEMRTIRQSRRWSTPR